MLFHNQVVSLNNIVMWCSEEWPPGAWVNHEPWGKPSGERDMHTPWLARKKQHKGKILAGKGKIPGGHRIRGIFLLFSLLSYSDTNHYPHSSQDEHFLAITLVGTDGRRKDLGWRTTPGLARKYPWIIGLDWCTNFPSPTLQVTVLSRW